MIPSSAGRVAARHAALVASIAHAVNPKATPLTTARLLSLLGAHATGPNGVVTFYRTFSVSRAVRAVATAKSATKKKAAAKKVVKKKAPVAKKKAAGRKVVATRKVAPRKKKPAKRAAKKVPKKVKKVLTPEQKAKKKETQDKAAATLKRKQLQAASLMKEEPRIGVHSGYMAFYHEKGPAMWSEEGSMLEASKKLGAIWKNLSEAEQERYNAIGKANRASHEKELKAWILSHDPATIQAANKARLSLKRMGKPHRYQLQDDRIPKRPTAAFFHYLNDERKGPLSQPEMFGADTASKAKAWRALTDAQKKPYLDRYHEAFKGYQKACEALGLPTRSSSD